MGNVTEVKGEGIGGTVTAEQHGCPGGRMVIGGRCLLIDTSVVLENFDHARSVATATATATSVLQCIINPPMNLLTMHAQLLMHRMQTSPAS